MEKKYLYYLVRGISDEGKNIVVKQNEACAWRESEYYDGYFDMVFRLPYTEDDDARAWATAHALTLVFSDVFAVAMSILENYPREEWPCPPSETLPFADNFRNFDSSEALYQWEKTAGIYTHPAAYSRVCQITKWMKLVGYTPKRARSSGLDDSTGDGDLTEQSGGATTPQNNAALTKEEALKRAMDARDEIENFIAGLQDGDGEPTV